MRPTWSEAIRYAIFGYSSFRYPTAERLRPKPWHPDRDEFYTSIPSRRMENSDRIIAHLARTGRLIIATGNTVPYRDGRVEGVRINKAKPGDRRFEVSRLLGDGKMTVTTGYSAPYGARVPFDQSRMFIQGNPMQGYSDAKLHVYDERSDGTVVITEVQNLRDLTFPSMVQCDGVKQYTLDQPSSDVEGSCAARVSLIGHTLRFDDVVGNGWVQRSAMAIVAASPGWIAPAKSSDGRSNLPDAPPMGTILRLKPEARQRLAADGATRGRNPQAHAVMDCYEGPGIMIVDSGGNNATSLEPDRRWDQRDLSVLGKLSHYDFEAWQL